MSIIFSLFGLLLLLVGWVVTASFAILWYEHANREPRALAERFAPDRLALAAQLLVLETASLLLTLLAYPCGWLNYRADGDGSQHQTPVLLLHGLFHNRACWLVTEYRLRRQGFGAILSINMLPWDDMDSHVDRVAAAVETLCQETGSARVDIVGHSLGGLVARSYLRRYGTAARVRRCVLVGAPNGGSKLAPFAISPQAAALLPGSDFLCELAATPAPENVELHAIVSRHDNMVLPWESARLPEGRNLELDGIGHNTLLYHPEVYSAIVEALAEPAA